LKKTINKFLRKFGAEVHGVGYLQALSKGEFKKDAYAIQQDIVGTNCKVIFDVGANRGDTVGAYRKRFPNASIFAFEPFPDSFNTLQQRFPNDKNLHLHQLALADQEGTRTLYVNENVDTNSLLASQESGLGSDKQVKNVSTMQVKVRTIDKFCQENKIDYIDILKMDIQGGELAALNGMKSILSQKKVKLIYSEVFFIEQYLQQPLFHDISGFLHGYGYVLQDLYSPYYGKGCIAWGDVIFVKK
jgi:FkbM family methyltransferase